MTAAAPRAPLRRWFYAAYLTMSSAEFGVHHAAFRSARETGRVVRARLRVCSTRFAPCRAAVAPVLDHQRQPDAMGLFEKRYDPAYVHWFGPPQGDVRRPQPMGAAADVPPTTWPGSKHRRRRTRGLPACVST
jgi:hypothetical protein